MPEKRVIDVKNDEVWNTRTALSWMKKAFYIILWWGAGVVSKIDAETPPASTNNNEVQRAVNRCIREHAPTCFVHVSNLLESSSDNLWTRVLTHTQKTMRTFF